MDLALAYELVDGARGQYEDVCGCHLPEWLKCALEAIAEARRTGTDPSNEFGRG